MRYTYNKTITFKFRNSSDGVVQTLDFLPKYLCDHHYPPKTKMTMENQPFEDVSPIKNGDFPLSC